MNDEMMFLRALQKKPNDAVTRLVYADWLEEEAPPGGADRAAYLRVEAEWADLPEEDERRPALEEKLRALTEKLDIGWVALVSQRKIENCDALFEFRCPKLWENLKPTEERTVRFCDTCHNSVHFCDTIEVARQHAAEGHCVAVSAAAVRSPGDMPPPWFGNETVVTMGLMYGPDDLSPADEPALPPPVAPRRSWWSRLFRRGQ
jgi:uncharacterized protein (TIGR02996 family)